MSFPLVMAFMLNTFTLVEKNVSESASIYCAIVPFQQGQEINTWFLKVPLLNSKLQAVILIDVYLISLNVLGLRW